MQLRKEAEKLKARRDYSCLLDDSAPAKEPQSPNVSVLTSGRLLLHSINSVFICEAKNIDNLYSGFFFFC